MPYRPIAELSALQDISAAFYAGKTSRDAARSAVIDVIAGRLQCSRVSLWRFEGEPGDLRLLCFASKRSGAALETAPSTLRQAEYRDYFDELVTTGMYRSPDTFHDPVLQPMRERYLVANNVHALLDAAFMVNGRAYGMVCCEQAGAIRHWTADDLAALRAMVAKLALLMAGGGDEILWSSPSLPMLPFPDSGGP